MLKYYKVMIVQKNQIWNKSISYKTIEVSEPTKIKKTYSNKTNRSNNNTYSQNYGFNIKAVKSEENIDCKNSQSPIK